MGTIRDVHLHLLENSLCVLQQDHSQQFAVAFIEFLKEKLHLLQRIHLSRWRRLLWETILALLSLLLLLVCLSFDIYHGEKERVFVLVVINGGLRFLRFGLQLRRDLRLVLLVLFGYLIPVSVVSAACYFRFRH